MNLNFDFTRLVDIFKYGFALVAVLAVAWNFWVAKQQAKRYRG